MGKARESTIDPPAESEESGEEKATSEEEEVNGGSGSESDSESEPEESKQPDKSQPTKKPSSTPAPSVKKPETPKPPSPDTSSDEEDSGSDSESDSPETKPDPNVKPIASKPVETTSAKKSRSKAISAAGSKRAASSETGGDGEGKETKRLKKKPGKYVEESEKKGSSNDDSRRMFQRLWSEDDEIVILKGMIDYSAKKKADPVANLDDFHEFIKKSLHIDVIRSQLQDKIRRLRKKYANNADKEKKGKERIFAKDHEQKAFELSKKVWGNENSTAGKKLESPKFNGEVSLKRSRGKNVNTKKPQNEVQEEGDKEGKILISENTGLEEEPKAVNLRLRNSGIEEWIMENSQIVDEEKRALMDEKWKDFKLVEAEFYAKKLELMLEETKLVLDALKSSAS